MAKRIISLLRRVLMDERVDFLKANGVTTDVALYRALKTLGSNPELERAAFHVAEVLNFHLDADRLIPLLLNGMQSEEGHLRRLAATALFKLDDERVIQPLLQMLMNPAEDEYLRAWVIYELANRHLEDVLPSMRQIMMDASQPLRLRCTAIEWSWQADWADDYRALLDAPEAEIRFWAAYAFTVIRHIDRAPARERLDELACCDDTLPSDWGWSVGREALLPLAFAYHGSGNGTAVWVISPRLEYISLERSIKIQDAERGYYRDLSRVPQPTLQIDPEWLRERIVTRWPKAEFDVYQPRPRTYALNWRLRVNNMLLHGGLHVDGYSIVLMMGKIEAVHRFAVWYRGQVTDTPLYLTCWGDFSVELKPGLRYHPETIYRLKRVKVK